MLTQTAPTILIVDDSPQNLYVLSKLLRSQYRVLSATSGENGLRVAHGLQKPDLILLDVMMPDMNGYDVKDREFDGAQHPSIIDLNSPIIASGVITRSFGAPG